MILSRRTLGLFGLFLVVSILAGAAVGQSAQPKKPARYKVTVRYYIPALRDQHVVLFKDMVEHLGRIGFDFEPKLKPFPSYDYENRGKNILTGFIAGDKALLCLQNPSVASLLLVPDDYALPEDIAQPVKVRLELHSGLSPERTLVLANQVKALLQQFGFVEATGYDQHGYGGQPFTRIVGWIPVEYLDTLLKDLRSQPSGWFTPRLETAMLPAPLRLVDPIRVTEVLPDKDIAVPRPKVTPEDLFFLEKLDPELRGLYEGKEKPKRLERVEIFLAVTPPDGDTGYRKLLQDALPPIFIEGRSGLMVTALVPIGGVDRLAALPFVSSIRLARTAPVGVDPALEFPGDNTKALELSGLLDKQGRRQFSGNGVRVGIIDTDFRGYKEMVAAGKLPPNTFLVDLTAERNFEMKPEPFPDERSLGHGTHCALACALAAPRADLTLIRIDPNSIPQLQLVARVINGDPAPSEHLLAMFDDIQRITRQLESFQEELIKERGPILNKFEDERDIQLEYEILGPNVRGWLFSARDWHYARILELERYRAALRELQSRFADLAGQTPRLKGLQIVCTSLTWNSGYPLAGSSPLSRYFDDQRGTRALWFVSAGNTVGQAWTGPYRDADGNGVMEFAPPGAKLPPGLWTSELSFLAWQPHLGDRAVELPEGARVRLTLQWREPHDPYYFVRPGEPDRYLKPLADLHMTALLQRYPGGDPLPADDFDTVARSPLLPQRIDNQPGGSTYQQVVEFVVAKTGRYALRVERAQPSRWLLEEDQKNLLPPLLIELKGLTSTGIRPAGAPTLPKLELHWELQTRLFVEVLDVPSAAKGRVVWRDFSTAQGSIPMLADASSIVSVGAATFAGTPEPYSTRGAPGTLSYVLKPNVLAFDGLQLTPPGSTAAYGASLATPYAAGMAAGLLGVGHSRGWLDDFFLKQSGKVVRMPAK